MGKQNELFEGAHDWEMEVCASEVARAHAMTAGVSGRKDGRNVVWVTNIGNGTRRWFCEGYMTRAFIDAPGGPTDPTDAVVIPLEFLSTIEDLIQEHDSATLYLNKEENVITCRAGDEYAVIDASDDPDLRPSFRPLLNRPLNIRRDGVARVKCSVFERIASQYGASYRTVGNIDGLAAFTTLAFERGTMHWTTDWTRWGKSATSGVCPADIGSRDFTIRFYPSPAFRYFDLSPVPEDMQIVVDDAFYRPGHVSFLGEDWGIIVRQFPEGIVRHGAMIAAAFETFGFSTEDTSGDEEEFEQFMRTDHENEDDLPEITSEWELYANGDVVIFSEVIPGTAGHDCIRLSHHLGDPVSVSGRLLEELSLLNDDLVNARLVHSPGGFVKIIVDVDNPRDIQQVCDGITNMLAAIGACDGFEQFLPLFAGDAPPGTAD